MTILRGTSCRRTARIRRWASTNARAMKYRLRCPSSSDFRTPFRSRYPRWYDSMPVCIPSTCPILRRWTPGFAVRKSLILRRLSSSRPSGIPSPQESEVEGHEHSEVQREPFAADGRDGPGGNLDDQPDPLDEEDGEGRGEQEEAPFAVSGVGLDRDGRENPCEAGEGHPEEDIQGSHMEGP